VHGIRLEAAIPLYLLGYASGSEVSAIGMNVQVYDDDNSGDFDHQLSWADDPDNISWKCTKQFNIVQFSEMPSSVLKTAVQQPVQGDVTVVLNEPVNTFSYGDIIQALEHVRDGKFADAEPCIDNIDADNSIIKGVLYIQIENSGKAFSYLNRVSDDPGTRIGKYVLTNKYGLADDKVALYQSYLQSADGLSSAEVKQIKDYIVIEKMKAGENYEAARLIMEILNEKTYDPVTVDGWCRDLQGLGYTKEAMDYLEEYIAEHKSGIDDQNYYLLMKREALILSQIEKYQESNAKMAEFSDDDAKLFVAQNYFFMGDYEESRRLAEEIIANGKDKKIVFKARIMIFSVDEMEE
jgi:tetratricopeptide (TPR) repeat protein